LICSGVAPGFSVEMQRIFMAGSLMSVRGDGPPPSGVVSPFLRGNKGLPALHRVEGHLPVQQADRALAVTGKVGDLHLPPLSAGEVDQILFEGVPEMMADRRGGEAHEIAGRDLVRLVADLGDA